ncbi:hypothetical protein [Barnesiella viscericola]|uniref:Tetratricopeptide repeat protein n=1 Tax=Barnesiella viscericola TaxID=397865 RepID=A0A921MRW4_9BACT|nr:hypothetical protein [Barnesiella viscericola]HJG89430.1 hypothetical protein [Barnesiella viscericola]
MKRIVWCGILPLILWGLVACAPGKSDREESARLYAEAVSRLDGDGVTIADCLAAQELLEQAIEADDENIDVYFGKVLNELNLWRPDSAYQTATTAIEKIGPDGQNRLKAYFYTVKGFIAYDRGDEADARVQLSEALALYDSYLKEEPANMDYLLNKAVLLAGLEGKEAASSFIVGLPLNAADKQMLNESLAGFEAGQFGETWRAKHEALVAAGESAHQEAPDTVTPITQP